MEILGIIPARGGSESIPLKNIMPIHGKPLIAYTIQSALKSKINRLIVSTDNKKIGKISENLGAEVPFFRPKKISTSSSRTQEAIAHTLNFVKKTEKYVPDIVILLQPTSPHRTTEMINKSINLLKHSQASSVISVMKAKKHPTQSFVLKNGFLKPSNIYHEKKYYQRQLIPDLYYATGAIYTFWTKTFTKYNSIYGHKPKSLIIKDDELNVDIDTKFDVFVSEMIFQHWSDFKKSS